MKLTLRQDVFQKALGLVARIAGTNSSLPVLSNILLSIEQGRLKLVSTNLEVAITTRLSGKVEQDGSLTIPAKLLQEYVSSLPNETVLLDADGAKLRVEAGSYTSTINGTKAADFPSIPEVSGDTSIELDAASLRKALQQTVPAASKDEARPVLTGVFLHSNEGQLYLVATDSYRLAEKSLGETKEEVALLIPAPALSELLRLLSVGDDESVSLSYDEAQAKFAYGDSELVTRLIDGQYPNYRQLIPSENEISFVASKSDLITTVKVASLFARESAGSVTLHVSSQDQNVSIQAVASQVGENTSKTDAKVQGEGSVTLNSRYVLEALNHIDGDEIYFGFNGKLSPCVLRPANEKKPDYLHIVMPLKS